MADRPILFSSPMVRAIVERRKTQTRRVLTAWSQEPPAYVLDGAVTADDETSHPYRWPRTHAAGDRLWVRESLDLCRGGRTDLPVWSAGYAADGADLDLTAPGLLAWVEGYKRRLVPSIHMPRAASRITLDVTNVRVERLQDISDEDAIAEGVGSATGGMWSGAEGQAGTTPVAAYALLWNHINGSGAWDTNPWVAVYMFDVNLCNIDRMETAR